MDQSFNGTWMLVAEWKQVRQWPGYYHTLENTWQVLVITDGRTSYTVFTYRCGDMNWSGYATIGFNAAGDYFVNHPNTGSYYSHNIACLNYPNNQWYNLVYEISPSNAINVTAELHTIEQRKASYTGYT